MAREEKGRLNSSPVGTWELVSFTSHLEDGRSIEPWPNAVGRVVYDSSGNVTGLLISGRRNEANGRSSPPEAQDEFSAYFGTYRVDIAQGVITQDVSASLSATRASRVLRRSFELNDDKLILGFATMRNGVLMTNRLVWKRISSSACVILGDLHSMSAMGGGRVKRDTEQASRNFESSRCRCEHAGFKNAAFGVTEFLIAVTARRFHTTSVHS